MFIENKNRQGYNTLSIHSGLPAKDETVRTTWNFLNVMILFNWPFTF